MAKRKFLSRSLCFVLVFCMMVSSVLLLTSSKVYASTEPDVQLYYAQMEHEGRMATAYNGLIAVKNLAPDKTVYIHYTTDGKTWKDEPAEYSRTDPNDTKYEVWSFYLPTCDPVTFAIKYQVNGNTYWDNNNENNYYLSESDQIVLGKCALINTTIPSDGVKSIYLKNIAYQKQVEIRYTTDNWKTYNTVNSSYVKSLSGNIEKWKIPENLPSDYRLQYAVYYTVNGITYIDNNFGYYYSN